MMKKEDLLNHLEFDSQVFKNPLVKKAFEEIDRKDFVGQDYEFEAYEDYSLPTLEGQTITQPTTTAFILELLDAQPGESILNIGSGSGWTAALLASMVGPQGQVIGLEIIPELVEFSNNALKKYKHLPLEIIQADKESGLYKRGPYNKILVGAAFETTEDQSIAELLLQLLPGGVMIIPVADSLIKFEKVDDDQYTEEVYPGFSFAPYKK